MNKLSEPGCLAWAVPLSQRCDDRQEEGESGLCVPQQEDTVKERRETEMLKLHSSLKRER
ncbi:hypothetical protein D623_10035289 [Myotis brandtii]|uniref:Uncharacterized protein n=1 Tax=Myotis brandtii TaxID=109478 RepID=S7MPW5_MYOBR|nr:hypothetical protein D623_10035289 [Myotis brandtii]